MFLEPVFACTSINGRSSSKLDPTELFSHYNLPNFQWAPADVVRRGVRYFPQTAVTVGHPDCPCPIRLSRGDIFSFIANHHRFFGSQLPGFQNEFNQVRFVIELSVQFRPVDGAKTGAQVDNVPEFSRRKFSVLM